MHRRYVDFYIIPTPSTHRSSAATDISNQRLGNVDETTGKALVRFIPLVLFHALLGFGNWLVVEVSVESRG